VRLVAKFARRAADLPAPSSLPGNKADDAALRIAAAVAQTVGDVVARANLNTSGRGFGLRGGEFRVRSAGARLLIRLDGVRWVEDVAASGTIARASGRNALVRADVRVAGGRLKVQWTEGAQPAWAQVSGTLRGSAVVAHLPAP
jgi:hypothetical protein